MITVKCPHCNGRLSYPSSVGGTTVACLKCSKPITVAVGKGSEADLIPTVRVVFKRHYETLWIEYAGYAVVVIMMLWGLIWFVRFMLFG